MSYRPGLFSIIWSKLTRKYQPVKEKLIGRDVYGNVFYESSKPNFRGQPTRYHEPINRSDILNKISPEWDAWLRYRRQEPPSESEVMKNVKIAEMKKMNAHLKQEELIAKYPHRAKGENTQNEFNASYPKHKGVETNPGENKKR